MTTPTTYWGRRREWMRQRIVSFMEAVGPVGVTAAEIEQAFGCVGRGWVRPRLTELQAMRVIEVLCFAQAQGKGRRAAVYRLAPGAEKTQAA